MAQRDRHRRRHHGRRGPRRAHRRAGRPRPGPCRRGPDRDRPGSRLPRRGPRPGRALPALAGRAPRPGPRGGGHPGRAVRPGRRARAGGAGGGGGPPPPRARCRAQARCATCAGPLEISGSHSTPGCRWCGALAADWTCARCGSGQLRALVTGAARTAEELGRAFPGVAVRTSGGQHVLATVPAEPALVIATPGAEPVAPGGYAAPLLLDGWALPGRPSLRAAGEALRRWLNAAALVRPGAPVVVLAEATLPAVQALIRWDPVTFSERELAERAELGFPPAVRMASVTGPPEAVADFVGVLSSSGDGLPARAEVLGPV